MNKNQQNRCKFRKFPPKSTKFNSKLILIACHLVHPRCHPNWPKLGWNRELAGGKVVQMTNNSRPEPLNLGRTKVSVLGAKTVTKYIVLH